MRTRILTAVVFLLLPTLCNADYIDGNEIMDLWKNRHHEGNTMVPGYFAGVQDAYNGVHFCVPPKVTMRQAAEIIIKYMNDNPEEWHEAGKILVINALKKAFPCKGKMK